jgi:hypothetical protein
MPDEAVTKSLERLRTVLASRGIPTMILERHRHAISVALVAECGEQVERRMRFDPFPASLNAGRQALGGTERFPRLVRQRERRFRGCNGLKVDSSAELIASAWIDENSGSSGTPATTRDWLTGARRFSDVRVPSVDEIVAELDQADPSPC